MSISNSNAERLVEEFLEAKGDTVNNVQVQTSLYLDTAKLFSVTAYTEDRGQIELTVSIDITERK